MKRGETLLALLLSLVGSVLAFVPPGRPSVYGFSAPQHELPACGTYCGTERWSVKTLSDADRIEGDFPLPIPGLAGSTPECREVCVGSHSTRWVVPLLCAFLRSALSRGALPPEPPGIYFPARMQGAVR